MSERIPPAYLEVRSVLLLRVAVVAVFLGRAAEHYWSGGPYRALFWDEEWWGRGVADWSALSEGWLGDGVINGITLGIALLFLVCALAAVRVGRDSSYAKAVLWLGAGALLLLSLVLFKDKFYQIPQLMEYSLQWSSPLLLLLFLADNPRVWLWARWAVAFTFVGHGVYALGWLPVPVHFMEMSMGILGLDEDAARLFLRVAGLLDMWVAVSMFLPGRWRRSGLVYAVLWGGLTALARVVYDFQWELPWQSLAQGLPGTVYRFPHALVPLWLLLNWEWRNHA